jgi:nucleoside-diphosphate-sugar epimerase
MSHLVTITGATGNIGQARADRLLQSGGSRSNRREIYRKQDHHDIPVEGWICFYRQQ